jgi:hypothetical protein
MGSSFADMPAPDTANVIPLKAPRRPSGNPSPSDAEGLLGGCRDRLVHGAATAFAERLADAAGNLLALADRATTSGTQDRYYAANRLLATRGQEVLQQYRVEFVTAFDAALAALDRPNIQPATVPFSELCLVGDEEFERELTISRLSSRADYNCSQQLTALDRRIAAVRQGRRITQANNPLHPKAVFTAFLAACRDQGACDQTDLTLLQEFGYQVTGALPAIYHDINRYLAEHNVLPSLPLGALPTPDTGSPAANRAAPVVPPAAMGPSPAAAHRDAATGPVPDPGYAVPKDVFTQVASRLLASQSPAPSGHPDWASLAPAPAYAPAQVMDALTQLQKGVADTQRCPGVDPQQTDPTAGDLLRRIRATPLIAWADPMDAITVDVVAMLFDLILNDRDLPDALRAQVGRLQIPVLKVAMMDKGFFSNRQHPARRLLDAIVDAGRGWAQEALPRLVDKVRAVIETVLDGFEQDTAIFSSQIAELERFLTDEAAKATDTARQMQDAVEQEERKSLVRQVVSRQVQRHTTRQGLPALVRDFLERLWHLVLLNAYLRYGEAGQGWKDNVAAMDDLVWSVTPKTDAEERRRLLGMLPGLLNRLRSGLKSIDMEDEWDRFYQRLVHLHAGAVSQATATATADRLLTPGAREQTARTPAIPERPQAAPSAETAAPHRPAPAPKPRHDEPHLELARGLRVGAWIEFRSARGTKRALRLNWCSQQRGAYLFSNLQGDDTLIVATTRLAEQLRQGSARLLGGESPTERAVSQLLTTVGEKPAPQPSAEDPADL